MPDELTFRRMADTPEEYTQIARWLSNPQIHRFYEGKALSLAEVAEKFGPKCRETALVPLIFCWNGKPAGFLQYYPADPEEYHAGAFLAAQGCRNPYAADLFIGEPELLNRGIGTAALTIIRDMLFQNGCDALLVDPQAENKRALRCYQKCGMVPVSEFIGEEGCQLCMAVTASMIHKGANTD